MRSLVYGKSDGRTQREHTTMKMAGDLNSNRRRERERETEMTHPNALKRAMRSEKKHASHQTGRKTV